MRHQPVAMPFAPVATQCGLPKSPGTEPRSWRSRIGVRANDRFHSLIPPAGQNRRNPIYKFFSAVAHSPGPGEVAAPPSSGVSIHRIAFDPPSQGRFAGYRMARDQQRVLRAFLQPVSGPNSVTGQVSRLVHFLVGYTCMEISNCASSMTAPTGGSRSGTRHADRTGSLM